MEVKKGYKQTEVGIIPEEWELRKLQSFVRYHNSGIYKKRDIYGHGCNIIGISDLYGVDKVDGQSFAQVPLLQQERAKHTLECNDLLYGESSLVREGIARTVYVTAKGAGTAFAWHTRRYSIDQRCLLASYLYYYLQSRPARGHMIDHSIQTAITGINTVAYFACPVITPPLREQEAIATALSDADAMIKSMEKLIAKKRNIKQGAMQELLKPKEGWVVKKLGEVLKLQGGYAFKSNEFQTSGVPIVRISNIYNDNIDFENVVFYEEFNIPKDFVIEKGDVLIAMSGATTGKIGVYEFDFYSYQNQRVGKFVVSDRRKNDSYFVSHLVRSEKFKNNLQKQIAQGAQPNISGKQIESIELAIPKLIGEQTRIATILSDMDAEISALETKLAKCKQVKQGMMQELLTGRIRLV